MKRVLPPLRLVVLGGGWVFLTSPLAGQGTVLKLSLGDAARMAAERSAVVFEARARLEGAEARFREATGDLLPGLDADVTQGARTFNTASFGLDFSLPDQPPVFDPDGEVRGPVRSADARVRLDVPLLDLSALARRRGARAGASAAARDVATQQEAAAAVAALRYVAVLRSRAEVAAREDDLALAGELVVVARGQREAGVAVPLDVTRAEAQEATVRAQLLAARHRAEAAELGLRRALAVDDESVLEMTDDLFGAPPGAVPPLDEAVATALGSRSELRALEAREVAARESLAAARAGRYPRLSAGADDGYYGRAFGHLLNTYAWHVRMSVPLFDGFKRSARVQAEEARAREVMYHLRDLEDGVRFQVRDALLRLRAADEQVDAADERLRLASLEAEQEEDRFRAGVGGTADVVRAALRLNEARTAAVETRAEAWLARVSLASAMGAARGLP